jgi:superfamily II DNA or RNA helicase
MSLQCILEKSSNWEDIYKNLITYSADLSIAGKDFEQFAKLYFLYEPSVCNEYKNIWLFNGAPLKIKEKLGLGTKDYGVDLILEDHEGLLSVVQCKFKQDQNSSVTWTKDKLANMLADGDKADFFIIFTNASRIDTHTLSKKKKKLRAITFGDLIHLSNETIQTMKSFLLDQQRIVQPKKSPKDYQKIAVDKSIKGFEKNDRGQLILPCGTGKTLISLWIQERLNLNYTLVLFPSLALLRQTKNEWAANRKHYVPYICVCSEKDIYKGDSTQVHLYEISGSVSTSANEIRTYLQNHKQAIVFSTYQSLAAVAEAIKDTDIVFDLALCDEAHKTAGNKKGQYGLIHDDSKIRVKKRLYMTATPRVLGDNIKSRLSEEEVGYLADMSDVKTFGPEFHHMSFKEAIEQSILVDYKIIAMGVNDTEIAAVIKERHYVNDEVTADEMANNYALEKFMKKHRSGHAITFHSSVAKAQNFQERHKKLFDDVETYHVSGKQTTNNRSVILKEFEKSSKSVVTNARCLTEGVDIPVIDAVYFCDPKNSKIDIVQAAGRALRRADHRDKTLGYIVVPIFHRNKEDLEDAIEEGVFNNLISVIRSLSSHDERLVDEIKAIKLVKGERQNQSNHISIIDAVKLITIEDMGNLSEHMFDQVISKFRLPWRDFEEARAFVHRLNLKNGDEWWNFSKSADKPDDIPSDPRSYYTNKGWVSMGDWLGTGRIAEQLRQFKPFEEARAFVHTLRLNSHEWNEYKNSIAKPGDIPKSPRTVYKDKGWISMSDWLGTDKVANQFKRFKPFKEARDFVHTLKLSGQNEWNAYYKSEKKPADIPTNPAQHYKDKGWISMSDWLGNGNIPHRDRKYLPFKEAKTIVHTLNLKTGKDWQEYCKSGKKQDDIPANPRGVYRNNGWISTGDWLGTQSVASQLKKFLPFEKARAFVHTLKLKSGKEWKKYTERGDMPVDIPKDPYSYYKNKGWISMPDWLGNGNIPLRNRKYLPFGEARTFARKLALNNREEWKLFCKSGNKPDSIPTNAYAIYKNKGWISWGDWLGKE